MRGWGEATFSRGDLPLVDRETPVTFAGSAGARAHRTRPRTHVDLEWTLARARPHSDSRASRKCTLTAFLLRSLPTVGTERSVEASSRSLGNRVQIT